MLKELMASKNCCNMKKTVYYLVAALYAAFALISCNKNETEAPISLETHFVLRAASPETRTGIYYDQGTYLPYFQKGDEIGLFVNALPSAGDMTVDAVFANSSDDGDEALFEGTLGVTPGDVTFYSFYPATAGKKVYVKSETVTFGLDIPHIQHPVYDATYGYSFDPKADILIAQPATATVDNSHAAMNTVDMYFARLSAVLRLCVNAVDGQSVYGERIKSVKIETSSGYISGRIVVNPLTGVVTGVNETGGGNTIEATIEDPNNCSTYIGYEGSNNVFLGVAPVTIPSGSTVKFTINTVDDSGKASHKIVKEVSNLGAAIVFESSKPTVINLTIQNSEIGDPDEEDTTNYSGEWVIAGTDTENYVLSQFVSGNVYPAVEASSIDVTNEVVTVVGSKAPYKLTIAKITEGANAGLYTIKDAGDKYLTATGDASKNYLAGVDTPVDGSYWRITKTGGVLDIIATNVDETFAREIRVNYNNGGPRFSCYKSTSELPKVGLYPYSKVVESLTPAATPVISCDNNTITITCTTAGATIYYELGTTEGNTETPDDNSAVYDSANKPTISEDAYIKAIAYAYGYAPSTVAGKGLTYTSPSTNYYIKVSSEPSDWSGQYLIVYEDNNVAFDGSLSNLDSTPNTFEVTISSGKIASTSAVDAKSFTIASMTGGYSIQASTGKYIGWNSSSSNGLSSSNSALLNTISWTDHPVITCSAGTKTLGFNNASGQKKFRYLGNSSISLYKLIDNTDYTINCSSNNDSYGTVTPNVPTAKVGTTITLTIAPADGYKLTSISATDASSNTIALTTVDATHKTFTMPASNVTVSAAFDEDNGSKAWHLVTDASSLSEDDLLVLVCESTNAAAGNISSQIMSSVSVSISSHTISSLPSEVVQLTLGGSSGAWTFANGSGELLGATAAKKLAWDTGTTTWSISIADGNATITNGTSSYGTMQYNSGSPRFTTYTSSQTAIQLYRYE